jgi:hypothetical protein
LPEAAAEPTAEATTAWERLLGALEARLAHWQSALDGAGPYPDELSWPEGLGPCPAHLEARAQRILAAQGDLHERLAARHAAVGALLRRSESPRHDASPALFVDQRC